MPRRTTAALLCVALCMGGVGCGSGGTTHDPGGPDPDSRAAPAPAAAGPLTPGDTPSGPQPGEPIRGGAIDGGLAPGGPSASDGAAAWEPLDAATPADAGSDAGAATAEAGRRTDCDDAASFDARVTQQGQQWVAERNGAELYRGDDMMDAMQAALDGLTPGRAEIESVVVCGSGQVGPHDYAWTGDVKAVDLPSYSRLDVRGTIDVRDEGEGVIVPLRCLQQHHVQVDNLRVTGNPRYAVWLQSCDDVELGEIEISLSNVLTIGHGIRIDAARGPRSERVVLRRAVVEGTGTHGVETYGVDGIEIGEVRARDTGGCGLLLNDTTDAEVGRVEADRAGSGTGYAAFRIANGAGPGIHVGEVIARGGGRGVFCVSESGGLSVDRVDIQGTESNGILIENCDDVTIATQAGRVAGADVRIAARADLSPTTNVTLQNLRVEDGALRESPCSGSGNRAVDNTLVRSALELCAGTESSGNQVGD
ncbi:MAG: right-handed parallel beta-helix repeat-containing protein [Myxococcales bacterium]